MRCWFKFNRGIRVALRLLAAFVVCVGPLATYAADQDDRFAIVIHGGAGQSASTETRDQRRAVLHKALDVGCGLLRSGTSSLDTVEAVVRILEDSPHFNAGKGAVLNAEGRHELDATIMDGRNRSAGAVGGVTTIKNPVSLARRVMTDTPHVLLVTQGAEQFADGYADDAMIERVRNDYFSTDVERKKWQNNKASAGNEHVGGTVGCAALDRHGNLAAATSTGGLRNKKYGRLGDSPIAGAGTFADNGTCAVSCTGIGEDFIRNAVAYDVSARMRYLGVSLETAADAILRDKQHPVRGGMIAVDRQGQIVMRFSSSGMVCAAADSSGRREVYVSLVGEPQPQVSWSEAREKK